MHNSVIGPESEFDKIIRLTTAKGGTGGFSDAESEIILKNSSSKGSGAIIKKEIIESMTAN